MQIYKAKTHKFSGTDFREVHQKAFGLYTEIKKRSKRRTYIRSAFFDKENLAKKQKFLISVFPVEGPIL